MYEIEGSVLILAKPIGDGLFETGPVLDEGMLVEFILGEQPPEFFGRVGPRCIGRQG